MILFVNDSFFSLQIATPILEMHSKHIQAIVISTKIRGDIAASLKILRRCSMRYAAYRLIVDAVTRVNASFRRKSVVSMASRLNIPILRSPDINSDVAVLNLLPTDLGLVINFDQILKDSFLARFDHGVINLHASRLPADRGISPVLWAFARGDRSVWASIYRVDKGLDTGPIFEQYETAVLQTDTAFSIYERTCAEGGERLANLLSKLVSGNIPTPTAQHGEKSAPLSWPDTEFDTLLKRSRRRLISFTNVGHALRG